MEFGSQIGAPIFSGIVVIFFKIGINVEYPLFSWCYCLTVTDIYGCV
jgi:hypothetical protein